MATEQELLKIKEIAEIKNEEQANEYLKLGWKLLTVAKMDTDSREYSGPIVTYSLGWPAELPAPKPEPTWKRRLPVI